MLQARKKNSTKKWNDFIAGQSEKEQSARKHHPVFIVRHNYKCFLKSGANALKAAHYCSYHHRFAATFLFSLYWSLSVIKRKPVAIFQTSCWYPRIIVNTGPLNCQRLLLRNKTQNKDSPVRKWPLYKLPSSNNKTLLNVVTDVQCVSSLT